VAEGFDLVLATADPEAAAAFYRDVLGGTACADASPWRAERVVAFGEQVVAFRRASESVRSSPRGIYEAIGLRVVALFVEDIEAVSERIEATGRRVAAGVDLPGKLAVRFARDADGNTLELIGLGGPVPPWPLQVGLTVRDADASRAFYADAMGWRAQPEAPISKGVTRFGFDVGPATLKLWQPLGETAELPRHEAGRIGIDAVAVHVGRRERRHEVQDPDGNRIELVAKTGRSRAAAGGGQV
jgi:catechol 2,3-dioxygenase-like lactoylglutathione lyase family enzyme